MLILKLGSPTCSHASPITRSPIWRHCCHGTGIASAAWTTPPEPVEGGVEGLNLSKADHGGASTRAHHRPCRSNPPRGRATIVGPCNQHGTGRRLSLGLWYRRTTHDGLHGSRAGIFAGTDRRAQTQQRASAVVSSRLRSYGPTHRRADVVELKTRRQKSAAANHTNWCVSTTGAAASTGWIRLNSVPSGTDRLPV